MIQSTVNILATASAGVQMNMLNYNGKALTNNKTNDMIKNILDVLVILSTNNKLTDREIEKVNKILADKGKSKKEKAVEK